MKSLKKFIQSTIVKIKDNRAGQFLFSLGQEIKKDRLSELAAHMTYYLLLALFPFLIFLIGIFSFTPISMETLNTTLSAIMPGETANLILGIVGEVLNNKNPLLFAVAMITAIWSSTKGAKALIVGVNRAYGVKKTRSFLANTGIAIFVIISIPFLALLSFLLIVMGELLLQQFADWFNLSMGIQSILSVLRFIIPTLMLIVFFTLFYKFVPNKRLPFRKAVVGAIFTTFGWLLVSTLFSYYVNNFSNYTRLYGILGSVIVLLLWINLSSMIILIGAEIVMLVGSSTKTKLPQTDSNKT